MTNYRLYSIDEHGLIKSGYDAQCDSDDDALDLGHRLMGDAPRIEVWTGTRLVGCLSGEEVLLWWPQKAAAATARAV